LAERKIASITAMFRTQRDALNQQCGSGSKFCHTQKLRQLFEKDIGELMGHDER